MSATTWLSTVTVLLLAFFTAAVSPAQAQDCGNECDVCGDNKWEGTSFSLGAPYNMTCVTTDEGGCDRCDDNLSANLDGVDAIRIAKLVDSASPAELSAAVQIHRDRLLLSPDRDLVVIDGIGCAAGSWSTMVFLPSEKTRALEGLRLRSLEEFLALEVQEEAHALIVAEL